VIRARRARVGLIIGVLAASSWMTALPAAASVTVNCSTTPLGPVLSGAKPGSTIHLKGDCVGDYTLGVDLTLAGAPSATLDGGGIGTTLTVNGAAKVTLEHLTITDGYAPLGGGIAAAGSATLHLSHVTVDDNLAYVTNTTPGTEATADGGGIYAAGGSLTLDSCTVAHNRALAGQYDGSDDDSTAQGGGVWSSGRLEIVHSTLAANEAHATGGSDSTSDGGGIYASGNELIMKSTTAASNRASSDGDDYPIAEGGGLFDLALSGAATVETSHFDRNTTAATSTGGVAAGADGAGADLVVARASVSSSTFNDDSVLGIASGATTRADVSTAGLGINATKSGTVTHSTITGSRIRGVSGYEIDGGGTALDAYGVVTVSDSRITNSRLTADAPAKLWRGGAVFDEEGFTGKFSLTLDHDTISGTSLVNKGATKFAEWDGGGVYSEASTTITHSTIADNVAKFGAVSQGGELSGGGVVFYQVMPPSPKPSDHIVDSTITGNEIALTTTGSAGPTVQGGGVYDYQAALKVTDSTIARNGVNAGGLVAPSGGGLYASGVTPTLTATILADNTAPSAADGRDCSSTVASGGYVLLGTKTGCTYTKKSTDRIGVSPKLDALHANGGPTETMALKSASPAVNAVPKSACTVKTDQRGVHRPQGPKCDIGAYELKPSRKHHKHTKG